MNWNLQTNEKPTNTTELLGIILKNRGIEDTETFFHPKDPMDLSLEEVEISGEEVEKAIKRLRVARERQEKIIIYGDYDADGVCATTILWETLHALGFSVIPFLPDREKHGYGLSKRGLDEILAGTKPDIIISVDNGITAHAQWQRLRELGISTILTDHHEPDKVHPPVDCMIHTTKLCGSTVAWMFARDIANRLKATGDRLQIPSLLDLCAIATIADQVPLTGANRSFAKYGLDQLNRTERIGLQLLIESAGLTPGEIDTYGVNFGIAPRINAMGRIASAMEALRALCTTNEAKARERISVLTDTNTTRQELTAEMIDLAMREESVWHDEHMIVVANASFHEGVIGLIAGKLMEKYHKPALVFALGSETAKGSARSVPGVHITNMLRSIREDLIEVGGHPLAAGVKIETQKLELIRTRLYTVARETIDTSLLKPGIDVDCPLPADLVSIDTATAVQSLAPFGSSNREPLFLFHDWQVKEAKQIGKEGRHLKIKIQNSKGKNQHFTLDALMWNKGDQLESLASFSTIDLVGQLQINEWRGKKSLQISVKDVHGEGAF